MYNHGERTWRIDIHPNQILEIRPRTLANTVRLRTKKNKSTKAAAIQSKVI